MLPSLGLPQGPGVSAPGVGRDWGWRPSVGRWELPVEAPGRGEWAVCALETPQYLRNVALPTAGKEQAESREIPNKTPSRKPLK